MKRIIALLIALVLLTAGCSSAPAVRDATGEAGPTGAVKTGGSNPNSPVKDELKYYPTLDPGYKTTRNDMFDFWFDIPSAWKVTDKSENGEQFTIDPGNGNVSVIVYGALIQGSEDDYYTKLAGGGSIEDLEFRDGWAGKKITNGTKLYYIRTDGDTYIIFYANYKNDLAWYQENADKLDYIGKSLRIRQESFGNIGSDSITLDDLQLGDIKLNMSYEDLTKLMKIQPDKEAEDEYEGMQAKTLFYKDGTEVYVVDGAVYSINVISPDYATPRGLKVGDSVTRLKELYGEPDNKNDDNHWGYTYNGYELFSIVLEKNKIKEIQMDLVM